jgi:hypothetical protein
VVRLFKLSHRSLDGRPINGVEIADNVTAKDGRPTFLLMGLHHAREWPSGGHRDGDARRTALLRRAVSSYPRRQRQRPPTLRATRIGRRGQPAHGHLRREGPHLRVGHAVVHRGRRGSYDATTTTSGPLVESYTLTWEKPTATGSTVLQEVAVVAARGQRLTVDLGLCARTWNQLL